MVAGVEWAGFAGAAALLSSAKIGTSSWRYYTNSVACAVTEYYLGAGEAPGRWHGRGLEALGLEPGAIVDEAQLEALFARALHPVTGERLGRAWRTDGVTGFDLTFSAPKSVSALWALGNPDVAAAATAAHRAAVTAGLAYLDTHASLSRRGTDGTEQVTTAGLAVALFDHRSSRCGDPQLHTHALVVNKVHCPDGVWRTIDAAELFGNKKSAGMVYQSALRNELHRELGVVFDDVDTHGQAEITGVPHGLIELWSKRTAAITAEAEPKIAEYENELGRTLTDAERVAVFKTSVLKTRPGKQNQEFSGLRESWKAEATAAGFDPDTVLSTVRDAAQDLPALVVDDAAVLPAAVRAAGASRAVFSRADVAGQVAAHLPVDGRTAAQVVASVEELTDRALGLEEAVSVGDHPRGVTTRVSDARWASADVLAAEARVLSLAERGRGRGYGQVDMLRVIANTVGRGLDPTQYSAVTALTVDGDFLSVLTAPAGAGKTTTLGAASKVWQSAGYRVVGLAPSARAAAELATATGQRADTLAKWLHNHTRLRSLTPAEVMWSVPDHATVIIVDEASMANTFDLDRLTQIAGRAAAKVVLVGDPAQIGVVRGPGGMLAALAHAGHGIELDSVHRFTAEWEKTASLLLRRGEPGVTRLYQENGRLHPCGSGDAALAAVHAHWAIERAEDREVLMMARTHADVDALNARARAAAVESGDVIGPALRLGEHDWRVGDLMRVRRNDRRIPVGDDGHVRNGDRFRVIHPQHTGGVLVADLARRGIAVLPHDYVAEHAEYGWAATIDAAQGATTDIGIVLVRPGMDREHLYVGMTRGRHANHAYLALDAPHEDDHHGSGPLVRRGPDEIVRETFGAALATSGAQDAAHTARARAGEHAAQAAERTREAAERQAAAEKESRREAARGAALEPTPQHAATIALLEQRSAERAGLEREHNHHLTVLTEARAEFAALPRFAPRRRPELSALIHQHETARQQLQPPLARLSGEIKDLTRQVETDARTRQQAADRIDRQDTYRDLANNLTRGRGSDLAQPLPVESVAVIGSRRARDEERIRRSRDHHRTREHSRGRDRDDGGIGI